MQVRMKETKKNSVYERLSIPKTAHSHAADAIRRYFVHTGVFDEATAAQQSTPAVAAPTTGAGMSPCL